MLKAIPIPLIIAYSFFAYFAYYQKLHFRDFHGRSQNFRAFLMLFTFASSLFGMGFMIYYAFTVKWWAPVVLFCVGLVTFAPLMAIERLMPPWILSLLGFIFVPVCGVLMVLFLP